MLSIMKFIFLFIVLFAEGLVINNFTLKCSNKANKVLFTGITVLITMGIIFGIFTYGVNTIPFGQ